MKKIWFIAGWLLLLQGVLVAQNEDDSSAVMNEVKTAVKQVLNTLQKDSLSTVEKKKQIEKVAMPLFDYQLMGKLVLGKSNWTSFSDQEKSQFIKLYTRVLNASYFDKLRHITNETVDFVKPESIGPRKYSVLTYVNMENKRVKVVYKLYKPGKNEDWMIFDVDVAGVSIVRSYGSQYRDFLVDHEPSALFQKMKEKIQQFESRFRENG